MKKSLIALFLVVALVVTVSVFAVSAETTNPFEGQTGAINAYCEACGTAELWWPAPVTTNSDIDKWDGWADGFNHFYLTKDSTTGSQTDAAAGESFCLNLNGYSWTRSTPGYFFNVSGGTVNIMDSSVGKTGTMKVPFTDNKKPIIVYSGTVNQYGGHLTDVTGTAAATNGGAVQMYGGTYNMYGGKLSGYTSWMGGALYMNGGSVFNMYGGTIEGSTSSAAGGGAIALLGATFNMTGGTITGTAPSGSGGAINAIGEETKNNATVNYKNFITMTGGEIKNATCKGSGGAIYADNTIITIGGDAKITDCKSTNNGAGGVIRYGVKDNAVNKVTADNALTITGNAVIDNEGTDSGTGNGSCIFANANCTFTMSGGEIKNFTSTGSGTIITNSGTVTVNFTGGKITNCEAKNGGAIATQVGSVINLQNVEIKDCSATANGGAVYIWGALPTKLNIKDGTKISGCEAVEGGAIYNVSSSTGAKIVMSGGTIENCVATNSNTNQPGGGAVKLAQAAASFEMTGGTIQKCSANNDGGGLNAAPGTLLLKGGTIKECTAVSGGGGVYVSGAAAKVTLTGTTIEDCNATSSGGGMYIQYQSTGSTMSGGTIKNCSSKYGGAIGFGGSGDRKFVMSGGTIENCSSTNLGGGLYLYGVKDTLLFEMTGGTIKGCDAETWGANVCINHSGATFTMSGDAVLDAAGSVITASGNKGLLIGFPAAGTANLNGGSVKNVGAGAFCLENVEGAVLNINDVEFESKSVAPGYWTRIFMLGLPNTAKSTVNIGNFSGKLAIDYWAASGDSDAIYAPDTVLGNVKVADTAGQFQAFVLNTSMNPLPLVTDNGKLKIAGYAGVAVGGEKYPLATLDGDYLYYEVYSTNDITLTKDTMLNMMDRNVLVNNDNFKLSVVGGNAADAYFRVTNPANLNRLAVNTNNGYQFVTIQDGTLETGAPKFSTHRIQVDIESVSIKPATADLYYNVNIIANEKLAKYLDKYGVALDLTAMPDAGFGSCDTTMYTEEKFTFTEGQGVNLEGVRSCLLTGILPTQVVNGEKSGEMPIFANAYVTLTGLAADGGVLTVMADNPVDYSLQDIMLMVNANEELATNAAVVEMYQKFINDMGGWKLDKIAAAAAA